MSNKRNPKQITQTFVAVTPISPYLNQKENLFRTRLFTAIQFSN